MLHIVCRAQIGVCSSGASYTVGLELTDKQQHLASALYMMDIALASGRVLCRGALTLPVEQALIDGVVVIHGRGRIILVGLIECHKEHVKLLIRQPLDALAHGAGFMKSIATSNWSRV